MEKQNLSPRLGIFCPLCASTMGNCMEKTDRDAAKKNKAIEDFLRSERKSQDEIKLLLLGTGGSGKSTIAKQMKIIHLTGFSKEERISFQNVIYHNVLRGILTLIEEAKAREFPFNDNESVELLESVQLSGNITYTPKMAQAVQTLWEKEDSIQKVFQLSSEFQLDDSASYFLDNCQKFAADDYVPEECDILRARAKTTGIVEINFVVNKKSYKLVDVGGQRNERKKWLHCFQEVTSVIYCAALNEYDLLLEEDNFTNRMHESLKVFDELINSCYFINKPIILFLNKKDLFEEKIKKVDLSTCFPQYDGGLDFTKASEYINKKFKSKNTNKSRTIFPHLTTATDTSNVRFVFHAVEKIIMNSLIDVTF